MPAFYTRPQTISDILDRVAMRVLDQFNIAVPASTPRWAGLADARRHPVPKPSPHLEMYP